jgi:hypothetical protein
MKYIPMYIDDSEGERPKKKRPAPAPASKRIEPVPSGSNKRKVVKTQEYVESTDDEARARKWSRADFEKYYGK